MKKYWFLFIAFALFFTACEDEEFTKYETPQWSVCEGNFSTSMSCVIDLPDFLQAYKSENDKLAVFANGQCRGIATFINGRFFIDPVGTYEEVTMLEFRYYSSQTAYMYSSNKIQFKPDETLGTIDQPYILTLTNL